MSDPAILTAAPVPLHVPGPAALELLGCSPAAVRTQELVRRASALDTCVLMVGEPGVDIAGVARDLHFSGRGPGLPFVSVDCGAAPGGHIERMLLGGRTAHAPSDLEAVAAASSIAAARGGTLFLQHVGELPANVQTRIARILRDGELCLEGDRLTLDTRVMASATPAIDDDVREQRFRPELYRRLAATRIDLPPLRDRADDVAALAERILAELCASRGLPPPSFTQAALALLAALHWPGNLAELREVVARIVAGRAEAVIQIEQIVPALQLKTAAARFAPVGKLREARLRFERDYIAAVLQHHGWRMNDAAQTLGIQRPNLYRKARQLGIPVTRLTD